MSDKPYDYMKNISVTRLKGMIVDGEKAQKELERRANESWKETDSKTLKWEGNSNGIS